MRACGGGAGPGAGEVVADPQLIANDGFVEIAAPGSAPSSPAPASAGSAAAPAGRLRSVRGPVSFGSPDVDSPVTGPVPGLGEHTDEVFTDLAWSTSPPPYPASAGPASPPPCRDRRDKFRRGGGGGGG